METAETILERYKTTRRKLWGAPQVQRVVLPTQPAPPPRLEMKHIVAETLAERAALVSAKQRDGVVVTTSTSIMADIIERLADKYGVTPLRIVERGKAYNPARNELYYQLRMRGWTYANIGKRLDRNHATVIHGVQAHCRVNGIPYPDSFPANRKV